MNAHAQLLWQSVTAPHAAVDLANQHPNPYHLGWLYVAICSVCFVVSLPIIKLAFPLMGETVSLVDDQSHSFDIVDVSKVAIFYAVSFLVSRWFWRNRTESTVTQKKIDAAVAVSFASATMLSLPRFILATGVTEDAAGSGIFAWLFMSAVILILNTLAFSHATQKSFLNALAVNALCTISSILVITLPLTLLSVLFQFQNFTFDFGSIQAPK